MSQSQERQSEKLIIAVPSGPKVPGEPRHSEGSRLAVPTHRFLRDGCGLNYDMPSGKYYGLVRGWPIEIAEFRGSDIPGFVAKGFAQVGITGLDKALDLPDEAFGDDEQFKAIRILRELGFGTCKFKLGVPRESDYYLVDNVAGLRVATALPNLTQRIFRERRIAVGIVRMSGHVENAIRYGMADVIVDITETGGTMRRNGLRPIEDPLASFEAILLRNRDDFSVGKEGILDRFLTRVDRALSSPNTWRDSELNEGTNFNSRPSSHHLLTPIAAIA